MPLSLSFGNVKSVSWNPDLFSRLSNLTRLRFTKKLNSFFYSKRRRTVSNDRCILCSLCKDRATLVRVRQKVSSYRPPTPSQAEPANHTVGMSKLIFDEVNILEVATPSTYFLKFFKKTQRYFHLLYFF